MCPMRRWRQGDPNTVNHTTMTYVFDTQGRLRLGLQHTQSIEDYVADVRTLLKLVS